MRSAICKQLQIDEKFTNKTIVTIDIDENISDVTFNLLWLF